MEKSNLIIILITLLSLNAQALFEVKDASDNTVLEISNDGLRVFNEGDTLMVISSSEIKAFIDESAKDKALSRSFSVTTSAASGKGDSKMFEIGSSSGAIFYNPADNADKIFSINKDSIVANVNPLLDRDFIINDQAAAKGGGNLMKISNKDTFTAVDDSTMLWYKQKNAFRVGHIKIASDSEVGQASFASGRQTTASGNFSTALGYLSEASGSSSFASGNRVVASSAGSCALGTLTEATGSYSTAMGISTEALGNYSTATGYLTDAIGDGSVTFGTLTTSRGDNSVAMGYFTTAKPYCSVAIGRHNTVGGTTDTWVDSEPLFLIGNGESDTERSNAMKVNKNGQVLFPSLYTETSTNLKKDLYVDTAGKLCIVAKGDEDFSNDAEIVALKEENEKLKNRLNEIEEILRKLDK